MACIPATDKQIARLIAYGVRLETASNYGKRQAAGVISSYESSGKKPDWSLCRKPRQQPLEPYIFKTSPASNMPPSEWQRERLSMLGAATVPGSYSEAKNLIGQLEAGRGRGGR